MNVCKHKCRQFVSWYGKYSSFNSHIDCHLNSLDQDEHSDGHRDKYAMPTETKANTYTKLTRLFENKIYMNVCKHKCRQFVSRRKIFVIQLTAPPLLLAVFYKNIDINNIHFSPSHIPYHMYLSGCDRLLLHISHFPSQISFIYVHRLFVLAPREELVSNPARWSFSFIMGTLHWSRNQLNPSGQPTF